MADALKVITTAQISTSPNKQAKKLDVCFFHSKQKYHENDKYRLISIDID